MCHICPCIPGLVHVETCTAPEKVNNATISVQPAITGDLIKLDPWFFLNKLSNIHPRSLEPFTMCNSPVRHFNFSPFDNLGLFRFLPYFMQDIT